MGEGEGKSEGPKAPQMYRRPSNAPARGLLRRLAGVARGVSESAGSDRLAKRTAAQGGNPEADEQVELPVFFGRSKQ
jgi:hypothetical protein